MIEVPTNTRILNLIKKSSGYTYDTTRKLGALIPLEVETQETIEKPLPQVLIDDFRKAKGEDFWTSNDIKLLRKAARCEIYHFYRALNDSLNKNKSESLLKELSLDRDQMTMNIIKGMSVSDAFKESCGEEVIEKLMLNSSMTNESTPT